MNENICFIISGYLINILIKIHRNNGDLFVSKNNLAHQ